MTAIFIFTFHIVVVFKIFLNKILSIVFITKLFLTLLTVIDVIFIFAMNYSKWLRFILISRICFTLIK